jgi:transposase
MSSLQISFHPTVNPLKRRGDWHWSRCSGFMEHLTDRQAADAVRSRLDWKYALSLELTDPGFDHTVLSEFRSRLVKGNAEERLLDLLLQRSQEGGWLKARGRQRTDSTHVLAKIRALNRVLCVAQTMVYVLNVRIARSPRSGFVRTCQSSGSNAMESDWSMSACQRKRTNASSMPIKWEPMGGPSCMRLPAPSTADWLKTLPAVTTLRTIWEQQFEPQEKGGQWRLEPALPAAQLINSPYDLDARYGREKDDAVGGLQSPF